MAKRKRGEGSVFSMKGSRFLWLKWYDADGKAHRESAKTEDERQALKALRSRLAKVDAGETVNPKLDKVRYEEAERDLIEYYRQHERRNLQEVTRRLRPLSASFGAP